MAKCNSLHIKLEDDLHGRLVQMAKADRRSVNNLVEKLLHEPPALQATTTLNGHHHDKAPRRAAT